MKSGDLIRIVDLPQYWGASDIRGSLGIIINLIHDSNFCEILLGDGESIVISTVYLTVINEITNCKLSKNNPRS